MLLLKAAAIACVLAAAPEGVSAAPVKDASLEATVTSLTKFVRVKRAGKKKYFNAEAGMSLKEGDRIYTLDKGKCELAFSGAHIVRLGPNSHMVISRYSRTRGSGRILLHLLKGRVRALINRARGDGEDFGIFGAMTVTAVKGTDYEVFRKLDGSVLVSVMEGRVLVGEIENEEPDQVERIFMALLMRQIGSVLMEGHQMEFVPGKGFPAPIPLPPGWFDIWGIGKDKDAAKKSPSSPAAPAIPRLPRGGGFP